MPAEKKAALDQDEFIKFDPDKLYYNLVNRFARMRQQLAKYVTEALQVYNGRDITKF